jgi:hypothetical protein
LAGPEIVPSDASSILSPHAFTLSLHYDAVPRTQVLVCFPCRLYVPQTCCRRVHLPNRAQLTGNLGNQNFLNLRSVNYAIYHGRSCAKTRVLPFKYHRSPSTYLFASMEQGSDIESQGSRAGQRHTRHHSSPRTSAPNSRRWPGRRSRRQRRADEGKKPDGTF